MLLEAYDILTQSKQCLGERRGAGEFCDGTLSAGHKDGEKKPPCKFGKGEGFASLATDASRCRSWNRREGRAGEASTGCAQ
eukprot:3279880-Lingulodinium_polyedra.AAC.1